MFRMIFDPEERLQNLRERLEEAKDDTSQKVVDPVRQAFRATIQSINTRIKARVTPITTGEVIGAKKKVAVDTLRYSTSESITEEEIRLEVVTTAKGVATSEYGDSRTRPTGIVRQEALSLQMDVERILKDVLEEV